MTTNPTPIRPSNPFEAARQALIKSLTELKVPGAIPVFPHPSCFAVAADHVREASRLFDEWLSAIGHEIADNSVCHVDHKQFRSAYTDAVDGNALYECERAAEALIEEHEELMRAS